MDMTRFEDGNDPGFKAVAGELRRWVKELGQSKISDNGEPASANAVDASCTSTELSCIAMQTAYRSNWVVPKPPFMIPFPRDGMFVGREDIIAETNRRYEQAALQSHTRLALAGLGGVG
jgi:hypothetical protein